MFYFERSIKVRPVHVSVTDKKVGFWMEFLEKFFKKSGGMVLTPQQTMQMFDTFSFHNRKMKFFFISLFLSS